MTESERRALHLAARLLEAGFAPADPPAPKDGGGPTLGVYLAARLARVVKSPQDAAHLAAALRSAADPVPAAA